MALSCRLAVCLGLLAIGNAAFVQIIAQVVTPSNGVASISFAAPAAVGNTIVACASQTSATLSSPADSGANAYTLARSQTFASPARPQICWHSIGIASAAATFRISTTTTSTVEMYVVEYSNVVKFDRSTGGTATGVAGSAPFPMSVAAVPSACDNELAVLYCVSTGTATMAAAMTIRSTANADSMGDTMLGAAGATLTTAGTSNTNTWACNLLYYQLATSCPTTTTVATAPVATSTTTAPATTATTADTSSGAATTAATLPPNLCCGGLFPSGTCGVPSDVCTVSDVASFSGGAFTALKSVAAPPTVAAPLVLFATTGAALQVALSGTLTVTLAQNPINNTQYVLLTAGAGATFVGAFQSVRVTFAGPAARVVNAACISTPVTQTDTSVAVTAVVDSACINAGAGGLPLYVLIAAAVGGAVLIAAIVVIIVCCVRRHRAKQSGHSGFAYASAADATPLMTTASKHDYEPLVDSHVDDSSMQMEMPQKGHVLRTESDYFYH